MSSKERVLATMAHADVDRVPMDFSGNGATLMRLRRDLNVTSHVELLDRLHVDIVDIRGVVDPAYRGPVPMLRELDSGVRENFWGWRTRTMTTPTGTEEMYCDFILEKADSLDELQKHRWPAVDWFDFSDLSERLQPWQNRAVMASGASIWQHPTFLRSLDRLLMDMVSDPPLADYMLDQFTNFYTAYFDRMFTSAPGQIDILRIADDLGMQDRLLISPALFERFLRRRLARIIDMAHSHGVNVMFHSCGAVYELIPALIDTGIDILDPIQVTADGMNPERLKRTFGDKICFHGGIDTQYLLPQGSPEDIQSTVVEMIDLLGPRGFILSPSHSLQSDVPTANILALYETGFTKAVSSAQISSLK